MNLFKVAATCYIMFAGAAAWGAEMGAVDILVTEGGVGKNNANVAVDGTNYTTNSDGYLSLDLPEGSHGLQFKSTSEKQKVSFKIISGERTQLLVNLLNTQVERLEPQAEKPANAEKPKDLVKLSGQVTGAKGQPISGVRVFVQNFDSTAVTNSVGVYELDLPMGKHVLSFTHPQYAIETVRDVAVQATSESRKDIQLTPSGLVLDEFVVLAPRLNGSIEALIEVRRNAKEVADVMSAEQISKSGDSDAGSSLRRVTGLTLVDGKYVYVRGLGERYSSTLMNGVSLPSPDPTKRVVPLDIFPTHILDSLTIQKSFSPNMPGEFGGGTVVLNTKAVPEKFFLKTQIGQSIHSGATRIRSTQGGQSDWYGLDDGFRRLPENLQGGQGDPSVFLKRNHHAVKESGQDTLPEMSFALGDSWKAKPFKVGYTLSSAYSDGADGFVEKRNKYRQAVDGSLVVDSYDSRQKIQRTRNLGGIAGLGLAAFKKQKVDANYILLRQTTDYVAISDGKNKEDLNILQTDREWAENEVRMFTLKGENTIPGVEFLKMNWQIADSGARRYEPDKIVDQYIRGNDGVYKFRGFTENKAYQRRFFDLIDKGQDLGASVTSDLPWFYGRKGEVTIGAGQVSRRRQSSMRRFAVAPVADQVSIQDKVSGSENLDIIFSRCPECFKYEETTRPTDTYDASQEIASYYFKTNLPLARSLDLSTGMRFEDSRQDVLSFPLFGLGTTQSLLRTQDWLPGSTLTWRFTEKMQMRAAVSETVSRPDFKELSKTLWRDFDLNEDVEGNPSLSATIIDSYDLRWEYYYTRKGNFSVGVFYKEFEKPIEQIFTPGSDPRITFINANAATNYGAELELAVPVGAFTISGNYALIQSQISLENAAQAQLASSKRPLQGQSEYTANLLLDYENEKIDLNMSLAYNVYGKRIALLDSNGLPDIYEQPFHQVDFVFSKKLASNLNLSGKVKNILNPVQRFTQGTESWREFKRGQAFSLTLGMEI